MKFPASFTRYVGTAPSGGVALGADELPPGKPSAQMDNVLFSKFSNVNGWPVQRIAVTYAGPEGAPDLTAQMYFYEDTTQQWYAVGAPITMAPSTVSFFDVVAILEMANTLADLANATPGSVSQVLIVEAPGGSPPDGSYIFAMAPDLTSQA